LWVIPKEYFFKLILNFMDIRPVAAALIRADRQTDMMKLTHAFRDYARK
jgi:hypothetical protein